MINLTPIEKLAARRADLDRAVHITSYLGCGPHIQPNDIAITPAERRNLNRLIIRGMEDGLQLHLDGIPRTFTASKGAEWMEVGPGVGCVVGEYQSIPQAQADMAKIRMMQGALTPVQYVGEGYHIAEMVTHGRTILIAVAPSGNMYADYFHGTERENVPMVAKLEQGWVMLTYALPDLSNPSAPTYIIETVRPGFDPEKTFETVSNDASTIGTTTIPDEFWELVHELEMGDQIALKRYFPNFNDI